MAESTNINSIIKKHAQTGVVNHLNSKAPMYGDFTNSTDLQVALNLVYTAQEEFDALPAEVRRVAENEPAKLLELLATEEGTDALIAAGLDGEIPREGDPEPEPEPAPEAPPEPPAS